MLRRECVIFNFNRNFFFKSFNGIFVQKLVSVSACMFTLVSEVMHEFKSFKFCFNVSLDSDNFSSSKTMFCSNQSILVGLFEMMFVKDVKYIGAWSEKFEKS